MNPVFSPPVQEFQREFADFLRGVVPDGWAGAGALPHDEFPAFAANLRRALYEGGYLGVDWPVEYGGRGLTPEHQVAVAEQLIRMRLPQSSLSDVFGMQMFGTTVLAFGTEEQKHRFLPGILSGEVKWCQGYSEPQSGSDLASVSTAAVRGADGWHINGQKIWTGTAHFADWIFALVRTDPDAPKHRGLTLLACPLRQPGIEVRPIRQMWGDAEFNEVFFTDAVTADDNVIGGVNNGWRVATALLEHERGGAAAVLAVRFEEELDRLCELAREHRRDKDTDIRQRIAWCRARVLAMKLLGYKALTRSLRGQPIGAEAAMTKLYWSEYHVVLTDLAMDILGDEALVLRGRRPTLADGPDAPGAPTDSAGWITTFLTSRSSRIYAGTNQIQRNLLAESILGMPREPRPA